MRAKPKGLASGAGRHSGAALSAPILQCRTVVHIFLYSQSSESSESLSSAPEPSNLRAPRRSEKERLLFHWARRVLKRGLGRVSEGERVQARPRRPRRASHEQRCRSGRQVRLSRMSQRASASEGQRRPPDNSRRLSLSVTSTYSAYLSLV